MSKKNKKKNDGITYESQERALSRIDDLLRAQLRGEELPSTSFVNDEVVGDPSKVLKDVVAKTMGESLEDLIKQRREDRASGADQEAESGPADPAPKMDVSDIIHDNGDPKPDREMLEYAAALEKRLEETSDEQEPDYVDPEIPDAPETSHLPDVIPASYLNKITIRRRYTDAYHLVEFSDGVRSFDVDINTLAKDTFELPNEEVMNPMTISSLRLSEICAFMFPGLIMSKDRLNANLRHLVDCDQDVFKFFEYPDGNNNIIVGYYISDETMEEYIDIAAEMAEKGCLVSFLNAIYNMTCIDGFAFNNHSVDHLKQIMLLEMMEKSTKEFLDKMGHHEGSEFEMDHFIDSVDQVVSILPYNFMDTDIDAILNPEEEEELEFTVPPYEPPFPEEAEESGEGEPGGLFDGVEGAESGEDGEEADSDEEDDPEQAEREYYQSKGKKPPQDNKPKPKPDERDESYWTIPRR